MDDDSYGSGWPFAVDAEEAARLARDVQDLGFEAAQTVVDRFVEMFGQYCATVMNERSAGGRERPGVRAGHGAGRTVVDTIGCSRTCSGWPTATWPSWAG